MCRPAVLPSSDTFPHRIDVPVEAFSNSNIQPICMYSLDGARKSHVRYSLLPRQSSRASRSEAEVRRDSTSDSNSVPGRKKAAHDRTAHSVSGHSPSTCIVTEVANWLWEEIQRDPRHARIGARGTAYSTMWKKEQSRNRPSKIGSTYLHTAPE